MEGPSNDFIKKWFSDNPKKTGTDDEALDDLVAQWKEEKLLEDLSIFDTKDSDPAFDVILKRLPNKTPVKVFTQRKLMYYAAIFVLVIGGAFLFKTRLFHKKIQTYTNRIVLTMEDKGSAVLTPEPNTIYDSNGKAVATGNLDELTYYKQSIGSMHKPDFGKPHQLGYHTLTVPYGKTFTVTLSDGTKVFCDSGTTLKYPLNGDGVTGRHIDLEGRAYFEVAKNKLIPFTVHTKTMDVEVLGTHFNISAYPDDVAKTVLVEGAVTVKSGHNGAAILLKPNQMVSLDNATQSFQKKEVDVDMHTAWRKGELVFDNVPFASILKTFERKYGVRIFNANQELGKRLYTAKFQTQTIDQAIRAFQAEAGFAYEVTENGIYIK
ncbi:MULTISPECIES: FecR family protein [Flavobacteriaceae]|uniref:FecR family protein n=1 Tax=Flavobacteriaceae TaxID=49546 RepID=UPI0014911F68|nr:MULTISPECIES: FecR domain-containing protein [Allomuricauda]MDC6367542.1 DUF4974 domain-containing protein [Muricauda sp. AC10]